MWRRCWTGGLPILRMQHVGNLICAIAPEPHFDQRSNHDPDHLPEKTAALDADDQSMTARADLAGMNGPHGVLSAMSRLGKAGEIVLAFEHAGGMLHFVDVQLLPAMPGKIGKE